jgi:uncharacterized protein YcfL
MLTNRPKGQGTDMYGMKKRCLLWTLIAVSLVLGCSENRRTATQPEPVVIGQAGMAQAVSAAEDVLTDMDFTVEKADPINGVVTTKPLRAAQFFEFWRCDNSTMSDALEANLETLRRSVVLKFESKGSQLSVDCRVQVQRLSLPEQEVPSVSQAYRVHSRSTTVTQTLELNPTQRRGMTWIDLGDDPVLAQRIVQRIVEKIEPSSQKGAS